jgi:hypothetical protein
MTETISGYHGTLVSLSPTSLDVSIIGTLEGYGSLPGSLSALQGGTAALYAPASGDFTITNSGLVDDTSPVATSFVNAGIVLAAQGSLDNKGTIRSGAGAGVYLHSSGSITNTGQIAGYGDGLLAKGPARLTNSGNILGTGGLLGSGTGFVDGVYLSQGGMLSNTSAGLISGATGVIAEGGATTLDNAGTIAGIPGGFGIFLDGTGDRLIEHPGGVLLGQVEEAGSNGVLELAGGAAQPGTIGNFSGFSTLLVDPAADWDLAGSNSFVAGSGVTNDGTLSETEADQLTVAANISGSGVILLDATTIALDGSVGAGQEISFTGSGDGLELGQAGAFHGKIEGFSTTDSVILTNLPSFTSETLANDVLTIVAPSGTIMLDFAGLSEGHHAAKLASAGGATTISAVACFAEGTQISTPQGEVPVEALRIGDLVRTQLAGDLPIKWIGRRHYEGELIRGNRTVLPICIRQGALDDNIPSRDLWVSPGHAISIDHVLIQASRLLNGVSVVQAEDVAAITYFHIELDRHEILFAENCPAESFMDEHFREQFQNAAEFKRCYPNTAAPDIACQPRLTHGFHLQAIQRRVNARAGIAPPAGIGRLRGYVDRCHPPLCFGWAQDEMLPEEPVCLDIRSAGKLLGRVLANLYREDVAAAGYGSGYQGFEFALPEAFTGPIEVCRSADRTRLESAEDGLIPAGRGIDLSEMAGPLV